MTGRVTFDGVPPLSAQVIFEPVNGIDTPGAGRLKDGAFTLRVARGKCKVQISGALSEEQPAQLPAAREIPGVPSTVTPKVTRIPERFSNDPEFVVDVKKSGDTFTFDLTLAPPKKR